MCDFPASGPVDHCDRQVPGVRKFIQATRRLAVDSTKTQSLITVDNTLLKNRWSTTPSSRTLYSKETVMQHFNEAHEAMQVSNTVFGKTWETFHASEMSGAKRRHDDIVEELCVRKELEDGQIMNELNAMKAENERLKETVQRGLETRSFLQGELVEVNKRLAYTHSCYDDAEKRNMTAGAKVIKFTRRVSQKTSVTQSPSNVPTGRGATLMHSKQIKQLEEANSHLVGINQTQTMELSSLRETQAYSEARDEHLLGGICDSIATMLDLNEGPEYVVKKRVCGISGFFGWFPPP